MKKKLAILRLKNGQTSKQKSISLSEDTEFDSDSEYAEFERYVECDECNLHFNLGTGTDEVCNNCNNYR